MICRGSVGYSLGNDFISQIAKADGPELGYVFWALGFWYERDHFTELEVQRHIWMVLLSPTFFDKKKCRESHHCQES